MMRGLALLLPAIIPSWRFFAAVAPSPRIEFALLRSADEMPQCWQEFRPRPAHIPIAAMLARLIWNPRWNQTLFLVSCSERYLNKGSQKSLREILGRIRAELSRSGSETGDLPYFQMRLVVVRRDADRLVREEAYRSSVQAINGDALP